MFSVQTLIFFILVTLITYFIKFRWDRRRLYELARKLPHYNGISIFESIYMAVTIPKDEYFTVFGKYFLKDSPITGIWIFNNFVVMTRDADFIQSVFNSPRTYNKPSLFYGQLSIPKGILVLNGDEHKKHRKIFSKAFMPKMLERLPGILDQESKRVLLKMEEKVGTGVEFDFLDYAGAYSLHGFAKSNLNYEIDYLGSDVYYGLVRFFGLAIKIMPLKTMRISDKLIGLLKSGKEVEENFNKLYKFAKDTIEWNQKNKFGDKNIIINSILDPDSEFSEEEIRDEVVTIMIGAFETSSKTIATAMIMLGIHQQVQQKLVEEIDAIYTECNNNVDFDVEFLKKFKYMDAVLMETLRLFPVASVVSREASEEVELNGYLIPKGTNILICLYDMQREEKYWGSDANKFRPERFLEELKNPKAFSPFTGGKRICLGYRYAMISMKIFLINFLQTYKVNCATRYEDLAIEVTALIDFVNGYNVSIQKRN